ncbi:MAG: flagellar basal body-associated FliL family protein [Proteobacteria bacterium]|nr:flagellar basal body-associated FliL family protein [Pseudomonadota bacterium]MCH8236811.1 flagellar basal body-associated FliL family protein [Pseudomonadota bacterium]
MKKLGILFFLLLMLVGVSMTSLKYLKVGPFEGTEEVEEEIEKPSEDTTKFVDMDPLAISIFQGNAVAAIVQIQVKLETNGDDNVIKIKRLMPVINDAFLSDLHSFLPRLLKAEERIDMLIIKQRLQLISDRVAGKGLIKNVLVQSVIDRPLR